MDPAFKRSLRFVLAGGTRPLKLSSEGRRSPLAPKLPIPSFPKLSSFECIDVVHIILLCPFASFTIHISLSSPRHSPRSSFELHLVTHRTRSAHQHHTTAFHNINMNGIDTNGKAPIGSTNGSSRNGEPIVKVQPPRREDLQTSYAQVIKADTEDESQHGWYGSEYQRHPRQLSQTI